MQWNCNIRLKTTRMPLHPCALPLQHKDTSSQDEKLVVVTTVAHSYYTHLRDQCTGPKNYLSTRSGHKPSWCCAWSVNNQKSDILWMYCTTLGVSPCRDNVISTSAALLRHGTLCGGHQLVMALNSNVKSSLRANSSAGDGRLHSRTSTCAQTLTITSRCTNTCAH